MASYRKAQLFILIGLFLTLNFWVPKVRAAATPTPRVRTRYVYISSTPPRRLPARTTAKKPTSPLDQIVQKVGPAILGSGGVILGAAVAWYTLRRKTKALDDYFDRIARAQEKYRQAMDKPGVDQKEAKKELKAELTSIQEEVEMAVARKKLDQEQLIAIGNKIDRILDKKS